MKVRLCFVILLSLAIPVSELVYDAVQGPIEGKLAVQQLQDDDAIYVTARRAISNRFLLRCVQAPLVLLGAFLLVKPVRRLFQEVKTMKSASVLFLVVALSLGVTGCKPYMGEKFVDIKPNESAFVVPLEGASKDNQGKFESVEYLEANKIAAKRINVARRYKNVGRMPWSVEIVDTVYVITVDRSPISRHWTAARETGTTSKDDAVYVESKDSIGFGIGATITAAIDEPNASLFLYNFPQGKPLSEVIDSDVKAFVTSILAEEFGHRDLAQCKTDKAEIFKTAFDATKKYWDSFGVTIRTLGHSGGLTYENPQIQQAIDDNYAAEMLIEKRENEKEAQKHENGRLLSIEINNRQRAEEFNKALEAQTAKIRLEIDRMRAEADLKRAEKWDGKLPSNILPEGSPLLYGLPSK